MKRIMELYYVDNGYALLLRDVIQDLLPEDWELISRPYGETFDQVNTQSLYHILRVYVIKRDVGVRILEEQVYPFASYGDLKEIVTKLVSQAEE